LLQASLGSISLWKPTADNREWEGCISVFSSMPAEIIPPGSLLEVQRGVDQSPGYDESRVVVRCVNLRRVRVSVDKLVTQADQQKVVLEQQFQCMVQFLRKGNRTNEEA